MLRRIIYTRPDGGVSICTPSINCIRWMTTGGRWGQVRRGFIDEQIARQESIGIPVDVAARFTKALAFGGMSEAEAFGVIKARDCDRFGTAHEIVTDRDLPKTRWFRDAWRRSHNGGPVAIDINAARQIQWQHIRRHVSEVESKRRADWRLSGQPISLDLGNIRDRIASADDERELMAVWPILH